MSSCRIWSDMFKIKIITVSNLCQFPLKSLGLHGVYIGREFGPKCSLSLVWPNNGRKPPWQTVGVGVCGRNNQPLLLKKPFEGNWGEEISLNFLLVESPNLFR